jgi:hypothetical protein
MLVRRFGEGLIEAHLPTWSSKMKGKHFGEGASKYSALDLEADLQRTGRPAKTTPKCA